MPTLLELKKLKKHFGGLEALTSLDMKVQEATLVGLIGPNGAGKTTVFNIISGLYRPTSGQVIFDGEDVTGQPPHVIVKHGIARTFQLAPPFHDMSVLENVILGGYTKSNVGVLESLVKTRANRRKEEQDVQKAIEILEYTGLDIYGDLLAENLSMGWRKTLLLAIALAARPRLLLLDEPFAGLSPERVTDIAKLLSEMCQKGTTIIMIEHNMRAALNICQKVVVLNEGRKIAEERPDEIRQNRAVIEAYLGTEGANV